MAILYGKDGQQGGNDGSMENVSVNTDANAHSGQFIQTNVPSEGLTKSRLEGFSYTNADPLYSGSIQPDKAPSLNDLIGGFRVTGSLGKKEEAYIAELEALLCDKAQTFSLTKTRLNTPNGLIVFSYGKCGVALVFESAIKFDDPSIPKFVVIKEVNNNVMSQFGTDFKLLNTIIVADEDLDRYQQMAMYINNAIKLAVSNIWSDFTEANMASDAFVIDTNEANYRQFMDEISPHGVHPRCDIRFVLQVRKPQMQNKAFASNSLTNIAAVSAYVDLIEHTSANMYGTPQYIPTIRISEINTIMPSMKIVPILLALSIDNFLVKRMWMNQFLKIGKGLPNIGNLCHEQNNPRKLWNADSKEAVMAFISQYCAPAIITLDITEGRARIPGIERFVMKDEQQYLKKEMELFLKTQIASPDFVQVYFEEYNGYATAKETVDTREIDYFWLAKDMTAEQAQGARDLLRKKIDPEIRVRNITNFVPNYRKLFLTCTCKINPNFANEVANAVSRLNIQSNIVSSGDVDMSDALKLGAAYNSLNMGLTSPFGGAQSGMYTSSDLFGNRFYR